MVRKDNQTVRCDECQHKRDISNRNARRMKWYYKQIM